MSGFKATPGFTKSSTNLKHFEGWNKLVYVQLLRTHAVSETHFSPSTCQHQFIFRNHSGVCGHQTA